MTVNDHAQDGAPDSAPGYLHRKDSHLRRLRRIEGQVKGISRMMDEDTYCVDVLTQVSAATKALQAVALELLDEHMAHCVADAARGGGADMKAKLKEVNDAMARLLRSA